jgi:hypothetical protein
MVQYPEARRGEHLKDVLDRLKLTDNLLLGITINKVSSHYSMACELQSTLEDCRIEGPAYWNNILCMGTSYSYL